MSVSDLGLAYLGVGCVCAIIVSRQSMVRRASTRNRLWSALVCIPLWPLWAPFALSAPHATDTGHAAEPVYRVEQALRSAMAAAAGTAFEALWPPATRAALIDQLSRVREHLSDLESCIAAQLPRSDVPAEPASDGVFSTAQLRRQAEQELVELYHRHLRALAELAELVELLHAQLLVSRYAGASTEHIDELVAEVRLRLEAMSAVHLGAPERRRVT